ncbi:cilia- and flagella-associated protein 46 isoform X1 [Patagioenas fasciata]|uniref:cilia- and flagella-associated protein 46 isoform X1 n=1 Tax=Patagioenas fasciata TaxID=372321 RepID=UPI003A99B925
MDRSVRERLRAARRRRDVQALKDAYELIKSASQGESVLDSSDNFSTDLYVLCAEQAFELGHLEMSADCLQMYFKGRFPVNQFLGRAYLCQGQLHTPLSTDNLEEFEKFVLCFMKAIDFAAHDQRYHFLIYNASVLYWQLVRPYLQPGFRYCLIPSLSRIVNALNRTEERDSEWRAELMINLLECFLDASKLKEAKEFSSTAAIFIKENVPDKYPQLFSLMVYHKLMDVSQVEREIQNSIHLAVVYKMQMLKLQWDTGELPSDAAADLSSVYALLKRYDAPPAAVRGLKIPLILELARFSLKVNCVELAYDCVLDLKRAGITEQGKLIEIECLECEYEAKKIGTKIMTYTKGVVETQLALIRRLEVALRHAVAVGDPAVLQAACCSQWNVCLPLLQRGLRRRLRDPLLSVAAALEQTDSMLVLLRCQVHMEIARIEEDGDRIEAAVEHLQKALHLNNGGQYEEYLRLSLKRLQLYTMLYKSPERLEDRAALLIEQAKRGKQEDDVRKKRALLINAGLALAPDAFKIVLDSENEAKVFSGDSRSQASELCAKARHHMDSVERAAEDSKHLQENDRERVILWADLARAARAHGVWDVCRAACRFCLLYDDAWFRKAKKPRESVAQKKKAGATLKDDDQGDSSARRPPLPDKAFSFERDLLRILAEIRFINGEATVQLLRLHGAELNGGAELNDRAEPPEGGRQDPPLPESDPEWNTYSLWIDHLSRYAMENFQRAAEIGAELGEAWIVHNAAVYVLNHSRRLISAGRQRDIVAGLQTLLGAIRSVGQNGSTVVLLMLCNAVARGLILRWIPKPEPAEKKEEDADRSRKASEKNHERADIIQSFSVDPRGLPDIKAALEVCEFALAVADGSAAGAAAPLAARQQLMAAWVKAKQLLQQQVGSSPGAEEENNDEAQDATARILVGLEMYSCNGLGLMDFTVPSLSQLAKLALECRWPDSLVGLQTLTRLVYFGYVARDHETVMTCSRRILQSYECFHSRDAKKHEVAGGIYLAATRQHRYQEAVRSQPGRPALLTRLPFCRPAHSARCEMLSAAACIQGKSIMENCRGRKSLRVAAAKAFVQSARYAGEAGNYSLAMFAARHFWNTCVPLLGSPRDREQLGEPADTILKNIIKAESKNEQEKGDMLPLHQWITKDFQSIGLSAGCFLPGAEEDLSLRTSLYGLLFHIYVDKADWEAALKVLDEAIEVLPQSRHRLLIFKHMATVKAGLGGNVVMDIQKFGGVGEDDLSRVWRHLVPVSRSAAGQLSCFQNAIMALQKQENEWQKVDYLMEFAEWLYCNQFLLHDVIKPLDWAVDLLLHMEFSVQSSQEGKNHIPEFLPRENVKIDIGANDTRRQINLEDLSNIRQLEALFRAQTLLAVVAGQSSPLHQRCCLIAYACIVRIWQVSLSAARSIVKVSSSSSQLTAPQKVESIIAPKKEKDEKKKEKDEKKKEKDEKKKEKDKKKKEKDKKKKEKDEKKDKQVEVSVVKEKPKGTGWGDTLPVTVEEWARYDCPSAIRDAFKQKTNSYGINWDNFPKPTCTLYFMDLLSNELQKMFCPHLVLPVFQLAEVVATDVVECASLSGLYHLRLALICSDLKLSQASLYHEKAAGEAHISGLEQAMCRQEIALKKEKEAHTRAEERKPCLENAQLNGSRVESVLASSAKGFELNAVTGKGLSALSFPYLWIEKAQVLIQLGLYQPARLLLSEAHAAAQELGARQEVSRCLQALAALARRERHPGQARALLQAAQRAGGGERFWAECGRALARAVLEEGARGAPGAACEVLERTVSVLRSAFLRRPNRQPELGFMIASLEARKTLLQIRFAQDCMTINAESCQLPDMLQGYYNKLVQIEEDFVRYGHKSCSAGILLECANIHRVIAKQGRSGEAKHSRYLDAYDLAQRAVSETEEVFHDVSSLFAANETANISIPLMRQLANRKLNLVEILLDIFHLVITEKKLKEEREASCRGAVEAFLRAAAGGAAAQRDWQRMERTVGHIALAQLANVQSLCKGCPDTTSKCLYLTGKTLHLLALSTDPVHSDVYWKPDAMEEAESDIARAARTSAARSGQEVTDSSSPARRCQYDRYWRKIQDLKKEHRLAGKYLSQCSEALLRCMNVAFRHNVTDVLAPASLEMVECFQQFDPVSASQFLALHQSCSVSLRMKSVLLAAASDTSSSQLAALLHLQRQLTHTRNTSDLLARVEQHLAATSVAWRNLCIPVEHFNIMDELPSNFYIMILQHSEDRSHLYSSLIGKPGAAAAQQKGRPGGPGVRAKVSRFPVNPDTFCVLLEKVHLYKQQQMQSQLKQTVIQNLQECTSRTDVTPTEKIHDNGHDLTSDFSEILEIMEDYLKPVLSQVDFSDTREQDTSASAAGSGKAKAKDKDPGQTRMQGAAADFGLSVVLLGGASLMELPLEALRIFKAEGISSVSRDFSLQILYNRIHMAESETDVKTDVDKSKENKSKAHQKKNGKKAPVNRDLPSNCLSVDTRHLKYIVDPYNEGREAEALSPSQKLKEILEKHGELQWRGVMGSERLRSPAEWEQLLAHCSAFLFYGTETFLSHVVLDRLVAMNIPQCHLMVLLDLVRTKESYHRITNSGIHKSGPRAAAESPAESAMLLSLAGVRAVLANQWYTTLRDNAERLDVLSENLLSFGRTTGQIIRILQKRKIHGETDSIKTAADSGGSAEDEAARAVCCVLYGLPGVAVAWSAAPGAAQRALC